MVSFVEQATLKVNDESTAQIRAINRALRSLFKTANSFKSATGNIDIKTKGLAQATAMMKALNTDAKAVKSAAGSIKVNLTGAAAARQQLGQLRAQAQRGVNAPAAAPAGAARGGRTPRAQRSNVQRFAGGFASGAGMGFGGVIGGLNAVETAGYLAAKALTAVAQAAEKRDRTTLQGAVVATQAQREIIDKAKAPEGAPLPWTRDERRQFLNQALGDVQGKTPEERANAAVAVQSYFEKHVTPRLFAANPEKSRAETLESQNRIVKGLNLASIDLTETKNGVAQFSKDGIRVMKAIEMAQAAEPELTPQRIVSTLANLKTGALSMNTESLAQVLINANSRGVRAANEAYRAARSQMGVSDVKKLNNTLADMGLLKDVKRNKKGNVEPGSGTPVDAKMLQEEPQAWFLKNFVPKMEKDLAKSGKKRDETGKFATGDVTDYIARKMAGASSAAVQGMTDIVLGAEAMQSTLSQARDALEQPVDEAISKSWAAQWENLKVSLTDFASSAGDAAAKLTHAAGILKGINDSFREVMANPTSPESIGKEALAGAIGIAVAGIAVRIAQAVAAPLTSLTTAGTALQGSAAALTEAAAALGAKGALPDGAPGAPGEKGAKTAPKTPEPKRFNVRNLLSGKAIEVGTRAGVAAAAAVAAKIAYDYAMNPPKLPQRDDIATRQALSETKREKEAAERAQRTTTSADERSDLTTKIGELNTKITSLEMTLATQEAADQTVESETPSWVQDTINALKAVKPVAEDKKVEFGDPDKPSSSADIQTAANTLQTTTSAFSSSFLSATSSLQTTSGSFSEVFATGATQIGQGGQTAASIIAAGASSAGAAYGAAAAAAISAAVANVNVNVNSNGGGGGGGDRGNINNANGNR